MITFKTVRFKNFGSFGNTFTEIQLNKNNTTLVCGSNGNGKSFAFLDSISLDRKSTRLNSSHVSESRMPSSA